MTSLLPSSLRTGIVFLTMLLLSACATAQSKVTTLLPHPQPISTPSSMATPLPAALSDGIQPSPPPSIEPSTTTAPIVTGEEFFIAAAIDSTPVNGMKQPEYIQSFASYYAKRFAGRRTASGERYDPTRMTAATRDFPLQSWLRVINPANGKEVIVRINDRTGRRKTPLIDLSRAAAKELGFLGKGKIRVHVMPLLPSL